MTTYEFDEPASRELDHSRPNLKTRAAKVGRVAMSVIALGTLGYAIHHRSGDSSPFYTDIPVPAATQPHHDYKVGQGDTESSIAAMFGHPDDMYYENMINKQLPKADQGLRNLRPGEDLRLPVEK